MELLRRNYAVRVVILVATTSALLAATLPFAGSPAQGAPLGSLAAQQPSPSPSATPAQATPGAAPAAAAGQATPGTAPAAAAPGQPIPVTPTLAAGAAAPPAPAGAAAGAANVAPLPTITMTPTAVVLSSVCSNHPPAAAPAAMPVPAAMPMPPTMPMTAPFGLRGFGPTPFSPFASLPLLGGLPGIPGFGPPPLMGGLPSMAAPAVPPPAAAPAPPANSPVVTCVNTTSGIALSWTPYRPSSGTTSYTVYQCDRNSMPGQPGCTLVFTTDAPTLFGPVSMGYDYLVQAQAPPNTIIVSNRLSL